MICFPNAKINIGLHIISRREDGYHNIETVFYPIGLKDALEIVPTCTDEISASTSPDVPFPADNNNVRFANAGSGLTTRTAEPGEPGEPGEEPMLSLPYRFFQTGNVIQGNEADNLVIKALKLISTEKEIPPVDIHLLKKIPLGAGLGGGSSDAAFMLRLLNNNFRLGYSDKELMQLAARLGADCSFFIHNRPAFAGGIGDLLEPIKLDLTSWFLLLVKPDVVVNTKEAYAMITPRHPELSLKEIVKKPVTEWRGLMKNDFESPVFKKYPEICRIKQQLYDLGAVYASMSGSGSSVYGFFHSEPDLKGMFSNHFVWTNKEL
jgi:4-diphosphocytidyl-2-C-methyl-D-erythritol kinase